MLENIEFQFVREIVQKALQQFLDPESQIRSWPVMMLTGLVGGVFIVPKMIENILSILNKIRVRIFET